MLGKTSENNVSERLYDLIYELNLIAPSVLLAVLPQLEFKLKVINHPITLLENPMVWPQLSKLPHTPSTGEKQNLMQSSKKTDGIWNWWLCFSYPVRQRATTGSME